MGFLLFNSNGEIGKEMYGKFLEDKEREATGMIEKEKESI